MTTFAARPPVIRAARNAPLHSYPLIVWATTTSQAQGPEAMAIQKAADNAVDQWHAGTKASETLGLREIACAIHALQTTYDSPRDKQIAARLEDLYCDADEDGEEIRTASVVQFKDFFLKHRTLGVPKITLTPDGTLRVRWIQGPGHFFAIEFTGSPIVKLVAEVPRDHGLTARHFGAEPVDDVVSFAHKIGALVV